MAADEVMNEDEVLNYMRGWFDKISVDVADLGLQVQFDESPSGRAKRSASATIDSSCRIAQLVVWDTGKAELMLGDVSSGEVVEEHREITSRVGLQDATQTMLAWLEGRCG